MSRNEVLDTPFALLNLMLGDQPKLRKKDKEKLTTDQELANFFKTEIE